MRYGYDFETYEWTKPLCWAISGQTLEESFYDGSQRNSDSVVSSLLRCMRAIVRTDSQAQFWAHNGGKFDSLLILDYASRNGIRCSGTPAAGRLIKTEIEYEGTTIKLFDSYAVVQASLDKAAKSFGCASAKQFSKSDYSVDMRLLPKAKVLQGCQVDARIVRELLDIVESQLTSWGGALKSTFSSSAFSVLKHSLAEQNLRFPSHHEKGRDNNQWANEVARNAYYGGRVEVLHHCPSEPVRVYDVNSSYPWSLSQRLPFELLGVSISQRSKEGLLDEQTSMEGVVRAEVEVPSMPIPPLPYRTNNGMFFPYGKWEAWFPAVELREAMKHGVKVKAKEAILYKAKTPFESFVNSVYELKRCSTGAKREFAKLLLNGCYGKLGMSPERQMLQMFESDEAGLRFTFENSGTTQVMSRESYKFVIQDIFFWPPSTHYAMASYVTGYSRMLLWRYMREADVSYCDTDSVHEMRERTRLDSRVSGLLGELKFEGSYRVRYYAPKLYSQQDVSTGATKYKSKGFPVICSKCRVSQERPNACEGCSLLFNRIIEGSEVSQPRMRLANGQFRQNGAAAYLESGIKRWAGLSKKRQAFEDGSTRPWSVDAILRGRPFTQRSPLATNTAVAV